VKAAMAKYNTEESLELHDQNINTAKEHANDWNATIYPRIKDLYEDVGKFSSLFVQNYDEAESKIESLKQEYLTDEEFEDDLAKNLKVLEEMGMDDSVMAAAEQKYRQEGKYRLLDARKRNKFYTEIVVFLGYVYDYGIVYEAKATKTRGLLQTFKGNLGDDKNNFIKLKEYTENMNATSFTNWAKNADELGASKEMIKKHHEKVRQASARMKTFLQETKAEADVISGLTIAGQAFRGVGDVLGTAEEITSFMKDDIEDPPIGSKPNPTNKKKKKKLSQVSRGFKIAAGVSGVVGSIMDIAVTAQQMKLAQKEFDDQMDGLADIDKSTEDYKKAFKRHQELYVEQKTFTMTISTQKQVMSKLDTLEEKITAAIQEVTTIQAIWRNVTRGIENMKVNAEIARKRVVDEDTDALSEDIEAEKKHFFTELRNMYTEWNDYVYKPLPSLCLIFGCQNDYIDITAEDIWTGSFEEEKLTKAVMETIERSVNENVNQNLIPEYDEYENEVDTTEVPIIPTP